MSTVYACTVYLISPAYSISIGISYHLRPAEYSACAFQSVAVEPIVEHTALALHLQWEGGEGGVGRVGRVSRGVRASPEYRVQSTEYRSCSMQHAPCSMQHAACTIHHS
jgi:hypothetical protein